jgi:hypothetical protein
VAKVAYENRTFKGDKGERVERCAQIAADYHAKGYTLTVRQLYYQLVARGLVENTMQSYQQVVIAVLDGRMTGMIDWDAIEDRTRELVVRSRWGSPSEIVNSCARQYHEDMWANQRERVYVVVEKEALAGVLDPVCRKWDVPLLAARGYASASVVRAFAVEQLKRHANDGQPTTILYLGDHDPSGIDMPNDLRGRLKVFCGEGFDDFQVERIALNMPQVEELQPPENPAKQSDSRFKQYEAEFGDKSWELDALPPEYIEKLVEEHIEEHVDEERWEEAAASIEKGKRKLLKAAKQMGDA